MKHCNVAECHKKYYSKGLCKAHYERKRVYGKLAEDKPIKNLEHHNMTSTGAYVSWTKAKNRCNNKNNTVYEYYGGRGIKMCKKWQDSFLAFLEDMGERPEGMTLDRIDPNGDYEPSNCRWSDRSTQSFNRRKSSTAGVVKDYRKWRAFIWKNNEKYTLGAFSNFEDALAARKSAEKSLYGVTTC